MKYFEIFFDFSSVGSLTNKTGPQLTKPVNRYYPGEMKDMVCQLRVGFKKAAQCERGCDEPPLARKLPGGAELRPKQSFVGWVPNQQNRSPTDGMAPGALQSARILGPRDMGEPKQASLGPHLACGQIGSAGVSPRTARQTKKIHFLAFLVRFGPRGAAKFLQVPQTPQTPVNRKFREKTWVEPPNVVRVRKLCNPSFVTLTLTLIKTGY